MPDKTKPTAGSQYARTLIVFAVCAVFCGIAIVYRWRADAAEAARLRPDLAANSVVQALREYRKNQGGWPAKFQDLQAAGLWDAFDGAEVGEDGKYMVLSNYYYRYFPLPGDVVGVWCIPVGQYANKAGTHYLLVGRADLRHWMGPSLKREDAKLIVPYPTSEQFALLMLKEQKVEKPVERKKGLLGGLF